MGRSDLQGTPWHYEYLKNDDSRYNSKNCVFNSEGGCYCTISVNYFHDCIGKRECEEFEQSSVKAVRGMQKKSSKESSFKLRNIFKERENH